jgi:hypothetical protein
MRLAILNAFPHPPPGSHCLFLSLTLRIPVRSHLNNSRTCDRRQSDELTCSVVTCIHNTRHDYVSSGIGRMNCKGVFVKISTLQIKKIKNAESNLSYSRMFRPLGGHHRGQKLVVQFTLEQATKTQRGSRGIATLFL